MNKTPLLIIVGLIIIALGIFIWIRTGKGAPVAQAPIPIDESPAADGSSGKKMAFTQFLKQGGSYECTVNYLIQNNNYVSQVYVDNGKLKGESTITLQEENLEDIKVQSSFIMKDGFMYIWTSAPGNTGFKIKVPDTTTTPNGSVNVAGNRYAWNLDQIGDYTCTPWTAQASVFDIPANVTFQEIPQ